MATRHVPAPDIPAGRIELESPGDYLDWRMGSGGTLEVFDLVVSSERRRGKGRRLIDAVEAICMRLKIRRLWAITRAENFIAQKFYEELRFVAVPLRAFYGEKTAAGMETVDAVMYIRDLGSQA